MNEIKFNNGYVLPEYAKAIPPSVQSGEIDVQDIVIVGGGLSGLTLACSLAQLGIQAVLLDEDNTVGVKGASSRGICYTQKSLEIFDKLGIYERVKAKGIEWSVGRTFAGEDEVYNFDLKAQANFNLSEQPPFINIQQFYNEAYLVDRIQEFNAVRPELVEGLSTKASTSSARTDVVELRWGNKLTSLQQDTNGIVLGVHTDSGSYHINARYVIDCTGSNSPIRKWLETPFEAKRGSDRWCIADVRFKTQPPTERHTWIEAPFNDNRAVWQHLMGDAVWRIDYQMAPDADPSYVSREDVVRERLERQFGKGVEVDIVWVGPYAYRSECVSRMRVGSDESAVFYMGDTAKVVSPFGARGGNTGIADADNLAWKLAAVLRQQAPPSLLQSYHHERHEAAVKNVKVTNRTARYLRPADGMERIFRTATIDLAKQFPFARSLINTGRMAIANPYTQSPLCHGDAGVSVQNVGFKWVDRSRGNVNDLLRWAGGHMLLLAFGKLSKRDIIYLSALAGASGLHVAQVVASGELPDVTEALIDDTGKLQAACKRRGWALIRPDNYLAASGSGIDAALVNALQMAHGISS